MFKNTGQFPILHSLTRLYNLYKQNKQILKTYLPNLGWSSIAKLGCDPFLSSRLTWIHCL